MPHYFIPNDRAVVDQAKELIASQLSQPLSLPALAAQCGVSPHTLKRLFLKLEGQSVAAFSLDQRIKRAKELLLHTNNTLQMIAEETGYTEGNNFQQAFKRVTGKTPGEWRRGGSRTNP